MPLREIEYNNDNIIIRLQSDKKFEFPKYKTKEEYHPMKAKKEFHLERKQFGPMATYVRKEMWKVISELQKTYYINYLDASDIAFDEFMHLKLCDEECATIENIAIFRIACFNDAEIFLKK